MNLQQMRYAVEVDKTGSISQAAENLFMGQPNLSKAIKELEASLGIRLFKRTTKGVVTTPDGLEFLRRAKKILADIHSLEALYQDDHAGREEFRLSVPRSSYVAEALADFVAGALEQRQIFVEYIETNAMRTIRNVAEEGFQLGVIRYQTGCEGHFHRLLEEYHLGSRVLWSFERKALFSKTHPAAKKDQVTPRDLAGSVELYHGDCGVHHPDQCERHRPGLSGRGRVCIYDRGSQYDLLARIPGSFMWASPVPSGLLARHGLVQLPCPGGAHSCRDVLIYPADHAFSKTETDFLDTLERAIQALS